MRRASALRYNAVLLLGKAAAKRWCALEAVSQLHAMGALDDHLLPAILPLPLDGKPANAALADKIMDRGTRAFVKVTKEVPGSSMQSSVGVSVLWVRCGM
jgi:hypothetical protein